MVTFATPLTPVTARRLGVVKVGGSADSDQIVFLKMSSGPFELLIRVGVKFAGRGLANRPVHSTNLF